MGSNDVCDGQGCRVLLGINEFIPQIIHGLIGFSIIFTIHFGGTIIFGNIHELGMVIPPLMTESLFHWYIKPYGLGLMSLSPIIRK